MVAILCVFRSLLVFLSVTLLFAVSICVYVSLSIWMLRDSALSTLPCLSLQLFEGLKAYKGSDQQVRLFRPWLNMDRMLRSARRLCLPVSGQSALQGGQRVA